MQSLFDQEPYEEITARIHKLSPETQRLWGKMDVAQMMAHCVAAFKNAMLTEPAKRMLIGRLLGGFFKSQLYNEKPWGHGAPTAPSFVQKDPKVFEEEKRNLLEIVERFHTGGHDGATKYPHPFFGKITSDQWGKSQYKHIDHHLRQFGV